MAHRFSKYFGNYPAEFNRAVHGPYDPARFYGKADTPLGEVKINELGAWINRRNLHPLAISAAASRAYQRYIRRFVHPKFSSPTIAFFQIVTVASIFFYFMNYPKNLRHHKQYKHHW